MVPWWYFFPYAILWLDLTYVTTIYIYIFRSITKIRTKEKRKELVLFFIHCFVLSLWIHAFRPWKCGKMTSFSNLLSIMFPLFVVVVFGAVLVRAEGLPNMPACPRFCSCETANNVVCNDPNKYSSVGTILRQMESRDAEDVIQLWVSFYFHNSIRWNCLNWIMMYIVI